MIAMNMFERPHIALWFDMAVTVALTQNGMLVSYSGIKFSSISSQVINPSTASTTTV
jgi:hypothetical protein